MVFDIIAVFFDRDGTFGGTGGGYIRMNLLCMISFFLGIKCVFMISVIPRSVALVEMYLDE